MRRLVALLGFASLLAGCATPVVRGAESEPRGPAASQGRAGPGAPVAGGRPARSSGADGGGASAPALSPRGPRVVLDRERTGEAAATIVVINEFPRLQHVLIDGRAIGTVSPGATGRFPLPVGSHTVTSADSPDPDDNPSSLTELFEAGYRYGYRIVAW